MAIIGFGRVPFTGQALDGRKRNFEPPVRMSFSESWDQAPPKTVEQRLERRSGPRARGYVLTNLDRLARPVTVP